MEDEESIHETELDQKQRFLELETEIKEKDIEIEDLKEEIRKVQQEANELRARTWRTLQERDCIAEKEIEVRKSILSFIQEQRIAHDSSFMDEENEEDLNLEENKDDLFSTRTQQIIDLLSNIYQNLTKEFQSSKVPPHLASPSLPPQPAQKINDPCIPEIQSKNSPQASSCCRQSAIDSPLTSSRIPNENKDPTSSCAQWPPGHSSEKMCFLEMEVEDAWGTALRCEEEARAAKRRRLQMVEELKHINVSTKEFYERQKRKESALMDALLHETERSEKLEKMKEDAEMKLSSFREKIKEQTLADLSSLKLEIKDVTEALTHMQSTQYVSDYISSLTSPSISPQHPETPHSTSLTTDVCVPAPMPMQSLMPTSSSSEDISKKDQPLDYATENIFSTLSDKDSSESPNISENGAESSLPLSASSSSSSTSTSLSSSALQIKSFLSPSFSTIPTISSVQSHPLRHSPGQLAFSSLCNLLGSSARLSAECRVLRRVLRKTQEQLDRESTARRQLHDAMQTLKGNIRVLVRVRPMTVGEDRSKKGLAEKQKGSNSEYSSSTSSSASSSAALTNLDEEIENEIIEQSAPLSSFESDSQSILKITGEDTVELMHRDALYLKIPSSSSSSSSSSSANQLQIPPKVFHFDRVFGENSSTYEIFLELQPLVTSLLDGKNVCVAAYGQTGSGKTFTMQGVQHPEKGNLKSIGKRKERKDKGLIELLVDEVWNQAGERKMGNEIAQVQLWMSICEIRREKVFGMLPSDNAANKEPKVKHSPFAALPPLPLQASSTSITSSFSGDGSILTQSIKDWLLRWNLTAQPVSSSTAALDLIDAAAKQRKTAPTLMNATSSRSHFVCSLFVASKRRVKKQKQPNTKAPSAQNQQQTSKKDASSEKKDLQSISDISNEEEQKITKDALNGGSEQNDEWDEEVVCSKLTLIDLAGSENAAQSGTEGAQRLESADINKSLAALGSVLHALQIQTKTQTRKTQISQQMSQQGEVKQVAKQQALPRIPFRDSVLTQLLEDSLQMGSKMIMLICLSPNKMNYTQTQFALEFGANASRTVGLRKKGEQIINFNPGSDLILQNKEPKGKEWSKKSFEFRPLSYLDILSEAQKGKQNDV
ncbi:kinesin 14D [Monocercomonoides exilis]|uniref:kinesin 14D n=1 Tax=Monocercomonoides exilis TaxID=2049356 RepID=UPI003559C35E|nr:kinesin 14D [Monocercomonoides exilis]|eukprot:MONOS_10483.1-p1 / transcript=MONOS_10483.1 / gene=MONOS_10483 / organism=Monocercomonoides_exilis_PA203 / gene_product=kinesin 14D / transcript_product=kinesin 14D / location=Mono_scaffold00478:39493-43036(-) / protein_length=1112 / sequence_SO=supercontig / SO=protein_coding / is_pseudo=false